MRAKEKLSGGLPHESTSNVRCRPPAELDNGATPSALDAKGTTPFSSSSSSSSLPVLGGFAGAPARAAAVALFGAFVELALCAAGCDDAPQLDVPQASSNGRPAKGAHLAVKACVTRAFRTLDVRSFVVAFRSHLVVMFPLLSLRGSSQT